MENSTISNYKVQIPVPDFINNVNKHKSSNNQEFNDSDFKNMLKQAVEQNDQYKDLHRNNTPVEQQLQNDYTDQKPEQNYDSRSEKAEDRKADDKISNTEDTGKSEELDSEQNSSIDKSAKTNESEKNEINDEQISELKKELHSLLQALSKGVSPANSKDTVSKIDKLSEKIGNLLDMDHSKGSKKTINLKHQLSNLLKNLEQLKKEVLNSDSKTPLLADLIKKTGLVLEQLTAKDRIALSRANHNDNNSSNKIGLETAVNSTGEKEIKQSNSLKNDDNSFSFSKDSSQSKSDLSSIKADRQPMKSEGLFKDQINDLINKARVTVTDKSNGTINLRMYPERLGNVTVNLGLENGILNGKFLVDSKEARDMLLSQFDSLKERLLEEGINLGSFSVDVRNGESSYNNYKESKELYEALTAPVVHSAAEEYSQISSQSGQYYDGSINLVM
ncbi:MAG: flagellar hook-length control protein FliK [Spirochaetes bacterium]|nr:flagellar hook-length control protein FliK [Spirochaetota bacterium]MBN2771550.1 flagellar hook-length control protein FliK [Spirochaetota bacterium]